MENPFLDLVSFTGEEAYGRLLDLTALHEQFINLSIITVLELQTSYTSFLELITGLSDFPRESKISNEYPSFVEALITYLRDFFIRLFPNADIDKLERFQLRNFALQWQQHAVPGWEKKRMVVSTEQEVADEESSDDSSDASVSSSSSGSDADSDPDAKAQKEAQKQAERLLRKRMQREQPHPIYCHACQRQIANQTIFKAHLEGKKHKKGLEKLAILNNPYSFIHRRQQPHLTSFATVLALSTQSSAPAVSASAGGTPPIPPFALTIYRTAALESLSSLYCSLLSMELTRTSLFAQKKSYRLYTETVADVAAQSSAAVTASGMAARIHRALRRLKMTHRGLLTRRHEARLRRITLERKRREAAAAGGVGEEGKMEGEDEDMTKSDGSTTGSTAAGVEAAFNEQGSEDADTSGDDAEGDAAADADLERRMREEIAEAERRLRRQKRGKLVDGQDDSEEDTDEEPLYNPKNVPLGWDGKPIPMWLYKLNGLNQEFRCEICGGVVYRGPKNFEKHFQEWRHAHGMHSLHIPNTRHFHGVTKISDALMLYEKLKKQIKSVQFISNDDEELEDKDGNIHTRKMYEDMKREGLL